MIALFALPFMGAQSQSSLSAKWEELTAPDFVQAIHQSQGVCVLPFGIIEKHGPHLPLGTDLLDVRFAVANAVEAGIRRRLSRVLLRPDLRSAPAARHSRLQRSPHSSPCCRKPSTRWPATAARRSSSSTDTAANSSLLPLFGQAQLASQRDYVVYVFGLPDENVPGRPALKTPFDMHGGEVETSNMLIARPDLVHQDRAGQQSGADQHRQNLPGSVYTGIWWYARFPNHYAGDASAANKELGEFEQKDVVESDRRSHQSDQGRRREPQAAKPVLRRREASAGYEAVRRRWATRSRSETGAHGMTSCGGGHAAAPTTSSSLPAARSIPEA